MTTYRLTPQQKDFLLRLARKRDNRRRQEEALKATKAELTELIVQGVQMGIAPTRIAQAAGYTPSRVSQMRKQAADPARYQFDKMKGAHHG